ncbi:Solute carrier family 25 member 34 [Balamuthia mandrillaris]
MEEQAKGMAAPSQKSKSWYADYLSGGLATVGACFFSNPLEVVKTRLQLQGELTEAKAAAKRPYRNVFQGLWLIARTEGLLAIQKGLVPASVYQFVMNGTRIGTYTLLQSLFEAVASKSSRPGYEDSSPRQWFVFVSNMTAGAFAGVAGAVVASPFFLVKIRMQASTAANATANAVGQQYNYTGLCNALVRIWREGGWRGLWQGVEAAALRVAVGSAVQLATYDQCKQRIVESGLLRNGVPAHFAASFISGFAVCTFMNPFDVVSTRMYNQRGASKQHPQQQLYRNPFDCFVKTLRSEGIRGLYKGWTAHYLRRATSKGDRVKGVKCKRFKVNHESEKDKFLV